jgi:hypothetical protein
MFDALNFSALRSSAFAAGEMPALLMIEYASMSTLRTYIADTAANVRPLIRLAAWTCMSVAKQGPFDRLEATPIRKARV